MFHLHKTWYFEVSGRDIRAKIDFGFSDSMTIQKSRAFDAIITEILFLPFNFIFVIQMTSKSKWLLNSKKTTCQNWLFWTTDCAQACTKVKNFLLIDVQSSFERKISLGIVLA